MAKWFSRGQKQEKKKEEPQPTTKRLWGVDFNVVENGLDEEQVVSFVTELMRQLDASTPASVRSILKNAITDAEKIAATIKARAAVEAQGEAARIIAEANERAGVLVKEARAAGAAAESKGAASLATTDELFDRISEEKAERETDYSQMKIDGQTPFAGEVELAIDVPVDLKMVSALYSCLQTIPELRILNTRGSATRGTVITVVLNKPLPLVSLIASKMPNIELIPEAPAKEGKSVSPGQGKKAPVRRIKLVQKA